MEHVDGTSSDLSKCKLQFTIKAEAKLHKLLSNLYIIASTLALALQFGKSPKRKKEINLLFILQKSKLTNDVA